MDAHKPSHIFIFLQANVPLWLDGLAAIDLHCQKHGQGYRETGVPSHATAESQHTEIIHLENGGLRKVVVSSADSPSQTRRSSAVVDSQPKPASDVSSTAAAKWRTNSYRAQNAIVVSYDSSAQKRLEDIADGVTTAKEMIRKVKRGRTSRIPCMARKFLEAVEGGDDEDELDDDTVLAQVRIRREKMSGKRQSNDEDAASNEAIDSTDKRLAKVQDLCATAAFQLLRDGDCIKEAHLAMEELIEVLKMAKAMLATSRAEDIVAKFSSSVDISKTPLVTSYSRTIEDSEEMPIPVRLPRRLNETGYE